MTLKGRRHNQPPPWIQRFPSGQATESHNMMIAEKSDDSAPAMHGSFLKIHG
jgi:hypothetical protein